MLYDEKCGELAEHFLKDYEDFAQASDHERGVIVNALACSIQMAVERWFERRREEGWVQR